ncbi:PDDEXK nuclease domain-containing protein [Photorhabdus temperata]|uniref:PDDEXK nuclease domain-containing protein n=1 Tax=Photorhabdus temperata TaxID=574560 RepID=UPI0022ABDF52|nr:PDDEXK nuclease domain-containing protein [Photorhabdus temperata]
MKDPYVFDFLALSEPFKECELETELLKHLEKLLLRTQRGLYFYEVTTSYYRKRTRLLHWPIFLSSDFEDFCCDRAKTRRVQA